MKWLSLLKIEGWVFGIFAALWGIFGGLGWMASHGSSLLKMGLSGVGMLILAAAMYLWTRSAAAVLGSILAVAILCGVLWVGGGFFAGVGWLCSLPFTTIQGAVIVALLGVMIYKLSQFLKSPA